MTSDGPSDELVAKASDVLASYDIVDIFPAKIVAYLETESATPIEWINFDSHIQYAIGSGTFRTRVKYEFDLQGASRSTVAKMEFVIVVDWQSDEVDAPDESAVDFIAATTGYFAAFPYARELAQSATTRLSLDPLVLGILNKGDLKPGGISVRRRQSNPSDDAQHDRDSNRATSDT